MVCATLRLACAASLALLFCSAHADDLGGPPPPIPTDAELESAHARIGTVTIRIAPIFDASERRENRMLFQLADRLHADTRESTVRAHLLFREGDRYSRRVLEETARNLREQRYIREPRICVVGFRDGLVDIEILARDVWSTTPGTSFSRKGGANSSGFEFEELNLLGFGKQLSLGFKDTVDRSSYTVKWHDPSIFGTRWRDTLAVTQSDDGSGYELDLERPFYSLDSRWSAGLAVLKDSGVDHLYRLGQSIADYRRDTRAWDVHLGWSRGLHEGWAQRWTAGIREERADFDGAGLTPDDRQFVYPYLRFEALQDDFAIAQNRDQIARTEDICFGTRYALELGAARAATLFAAEASRGFRLAENRSLFVSGSLSGRLEHGSPADTLLGGQLRYYHPTRARSLFFAGLSGSLGRDLDPDHQTRLDSEFGMRGFPLHYQTGRSRALLTLEERLYTPWSLWRIANIGGAVFVEAGRTWGGGDQGLLTDAGLGLRLSNTRSALANVLHLDVAFPLGSDPSIRNVQFLVQTKKSF